MDMLFMDEDKRKQNCYVRFWNNERMDKGILPGSGFCNEMFFTHARWVSAFFDPSYNFAISVTNSEDDGREMFCRQAFKTQVEGDNASTHVSGHKIVKIWIL